MKITKLHLKNYQQFEDLELDFTYSDDHPTKAGQPLDKVCFIGPNGCGKTTIMEKIIIPVLRSQGNPSLLGNYSSNINFRLSEVEKAGKVLHLPLASNFNNIQYNLGNQIDWHLKSFDIEANNNYIVLDQSSSDHFAQHLSYIETIDSNTFKRDYLKNNSVNVKNYQRVDDLFESIGSVLKDSKLRYLGYNEKLKNIAFSNTNNDEFFNINQLSSGTKQILYRLLPIKEINPKDFVILIDEPEISFYPDIQKQIVKLYTQIGENNQLFFATHSPIIAGQFEKDELFILYFDENGKVKCRKPNVDPRYLDVGGVSDIVFGIEDNTPSSDDESIKIKKTELLKFKVQIEKAVESAELETALNLYSEFNEKLANSEFITQSINDLQIGSFEEKIIKRYEASKQN